MSPPSAFRNMAIVARGVFIELLRRKELYVLTVFMGFYLIGVLIAVTLGVNDPSAATFMINLGLAFAHAAAHILTFMTGSRQIPDELEARTIYPMLAKPVSRAQYLVGKWAAVTLAGCAALAIFLIMAALARLAMHKAHPLSLPLFGQTVALIVFSIALTAALSILGSLLFPKGVNLVLIALAVFVGSPVIGFLRARMLAAGAHGLGDWLTSYIPNFGNLNLINRYTDAVGPVAAAEFAGLIFQGAIFTAAALSLAAFIFRRRPL